MKNGKSHQSVLFDPVLTYFKGFKVCFFDGRNLKMQMRKKDASLDDILPCGS